jgi:hypothetical protein
MRQRVGDDVHSDVLECEVGTSARMLTDTAQALVELLRRPTTPHPFLVDHAVRLKYHMATLRQALSGCPRRRTHLMSAPLQQAIDGQADELAGRVQFIVVHVSRPCITDDRLAAYVKGLLDDVSDLLDLMGVAH